MISVVIILKNDLGVVDTIKALNAQICKTKFEIIVVDRSTIKYPKIESKVELKWINFDPKGKRFTIPQQRNAGIDAARGEIIAFVDANCVPNPDWLEQMLKPLIEEKEIFVSGVTLSKGKSTLNDLHFKKISNTRYLNETATIGIAFYKDLITKIGRFDESFDYGSDVDFSWRAIDAGYKIRFQPTAFSYHDWGSKKDEMKRTILYGKARARLILKHWRTHWKNLLGKDSPVLVYPILLIGLPITIIFPWYLLLFLALIIKNIKEPNPIGIVFKHCVYGWGVILEVVHRIFGNYAKNT